MASLKLLVCCVALVVAAVVDAHPTCKESCNPCKPRRVHECPDEFVGRLFLEIDVTVNSDYDWLSNQIELIGCKSAAEEYQIIIDLYQQLEQAKGCFDTCYEDIYTDIFGLVTEYREKYCPLSICYTERIVSARKCARSRLFPELCKFRALYLEVIARIEEFCGKYSIDCKPRAIVMPREDDYTFDIYFPASPRCNDLTLIYQNCFKDYKFLYNFIEKIDFPDDSPLCDRRQKLYEDIIAIWIDFTKFRQGLDCKYYQRFVDCWEDQDQVDLIYLEIIAALRPFQVKFGNCWFESYFALQDLCNEADITFVDYVDCENYCPQTNCRGSFLPSELLSKYFNNILVTCGMDYSSCLRLWNELDCKRDSNEWKRRQECLKRLRRRLREIERCINRLIRDIICKINTDFIDCLDNFDTEQRTYIDEVITNCNNELWPLIIEFRQDYYYNDDCLQPILNARGIANVVTRSIIPTQTPCYDVSLYCFDEDIRESVQWFEGVIRSNFYGPTADLIQIRFDEGCEEYKLRCKCLKDLESIWLAYRKCLNELFRKLIKLICKRKCKIGSDEYRREIKRIAEWLRPRLVNMIDRFKSTCCEINGILDSLYSSNTNQACTRSYKYTEAEFSFQISGSVKAC
ncbi:unnamed protein product [Bemisia tabaci]|uniref:Uncharacterized protein n=1 Tax=Bemisia tabaci TaxID=7038 RepID=A0A9P0A9F2_BEMTA|nr:unnamed protein product [Bemisia tabaci]